MQHFNLSLITKSLFIASLSLYTPIIEAEIVTATTPIMENPQASSSTEQVPSHSSTHLDMSQAAIATLAQSTTTKENTSQFPRYSTALQQALHQKNQAHLDIVLYSQPKQQQKLLAWLNKNKVKIQSQTPEYIFVELTPQQLMDTTLAQHRGLKNADLQAQLAVPAITNQTEITQPTATENNRPETTQMPTPAPVTLCAKQTVNPAEKCIETELDTSGEIISQTAMSLAILDNLSKHNKKQNLVFSPQSLAESGLALLLASSKPTQLIRPTWLLPQFQNATQFEHLHLASHSPSYQSWNQTWYDPQFKVQTKFVEQYQKILQGSIQSIDFKNAQQAAATINQDIAEKTKQHITQLLDASDVQNAQVVLTNAAYFKAQWQIPFESYKTALQAFKNADQQTVSVPTMNNSLSISYAQAQNWTMVNLPFHDGQTTLSLLLPPEKAPLALPTTQILYQLDQAQQPKKIDLALPKIKLTGDKINLAQLFPKISSWQLDQLLVEDKVKQLKGLHQATIEWDEQGAEAAAATAVIGKRSLAANIPKISFNRPFVFLIRDQKQVLFSGAVRQLEAVKTVE